MKEVNNCDYLIDLEDYNLYVNESTTLEQDNPKINSINFKLLNPSRDKSLVFKNDDKLSADQIVEKLKKGEEVKGTSYLWFTFPIGKAVNSFIDEERGKKMCFHVETGDWSVSRGVIEGDTIRFIVSCNNQSVIKYLWSISFECNNIISYAPVGFTYIQVDFNNVVGIEDVTKLFSLHKLAVLPQIKYFMPGTSTACEDSMLTLEWKTSGATKGRLSPGDYDITRLPSPTLDIKLNESKRYLLTIKNNSMTHSGYTNVYLVPPEIDEFSFDRSTSTVSWMTSFARKVKLLSKEVKERGTENISVKELDQINLSCYGYKYNITKIISIPSEHQSEVKKFECIIKKYNNYTTYLWSWETGNLKSVQVQIYEDYTNLIVSKSPAGLFEYVAGNEITATLICERMDGTKYSIPIETVV